MKYKVITEVGFEFTYEDSFEAWEMVQYIKGVAPEETVRIEVE